MEITVFAKKRKAYNGEEFYSYLTRLPRKDGTEITMSVRFRDECGSPKPDKCPMNVIIEKTDANISTKTYVREDTGEMATSYTMWVSAWKEGSPYVDHSLDEFDV